MEDCQISRLRDFPQRNGKRDPRYQAEVSEIVSQNRGKEVPLCCPVGAKLTIGSVKDTEYNDRPAVAKLTIGSVKDTEYNDRPAVVNAWGKFYLPTKTKMEVIGYAKGTPYPCDQLVLMTCEDQKVYGFDGDELHLVALSPRQMLTEGIPYPALQSYYHGEPFKDMTKEDWEEVEQGPVGKRLEEEHRQLVASQKSTFLQNLKLLRQRQRCHQQNGNILSKSNVTQLQKGGT